MTREEHLLTILSEECSEIIKESSKALRFGLDDINPHSKSNLTNREKLINEFNDLFSVVQMLVEDKILDDKNLLSIDALKAKKEKVEKFLIYSKGVGKL